MASTEDRLSALERRLQAVEDELAIYKLVVSYGFAVDTGDAEWTASLFAEDAVFDIDTLKIDGRQEVRAMVLGERHQSLLPNCAHTIGPLTVDVEGDQAQARGYSRLYLRSGDGIDLWRLSFNRWNLERRGGTWQIVRRWTRLIGHEDAGDLLRTRPLQRKDT